MYQKFIITGEGVLRFGNVYQHRELLQRGEECPMAVDCGRLTKHVELYSFMAAPLLLVHPVLNK